MRAVIQRVIKGSVSVDRETVGEIGNGLVVLLGVARGDGENDVEYLADKIVHLRIFEDNAGKMNRSLLQEDGNMLVVSQFTLLGDCKKGRRPSFVGAAPPELAEQTLSGFCRCGKDSGSTGGHRKVRSHDGRGSCQPWSGDDYS